jgi:hypothetical protein
MTRPICEACKQNHCAINYKRNDKTHYRSRCLSCINRNRRIRPPEPRWRLSGYVKKKTCDLCNFRAKHGSQIHVYHIDGNLNNNDLRNLRSICLNCSAVVQRETVWKPGDLSPD